MVLDHRNVFSVSFTSFNILIELCPSSTFRPNKKCVLPVTPWIIVSNPLRNAAQIFSYCAFSSSLPFTVLLPYYSIQGPDFYSELCGT